MIQGGHQQMKQMILGSHVSLFLLIVMFLFIYSLYSSAAASLPVHYLYVVSFMWSQSFLLLLINTSTLCRRGNQNKELKIAKIVQKWVESLSFNYKRACIKWSHAALQGLKHHKVRLEVKPQN